MPEFEWLNLLFVVEVESLYNSVTWTCLLMLSRIIGERIKNLGKKATRHRSTPTTTLMHATASSVNPSSFVITVFWRRKMSPTLTIVPQTACISHVRPFEAAFKPTISRSRRGSSSPAKKSSTCSSFSRDGCSSFAWEGCWRRESSPLAGWSCSMKVVILLKWTARSQNRRKYLHHWDIDSRMICKNNKSQPTNERVGQP